MFASPGFSGDADMRVSGRCATSCTRAWLGTWQNKRQSNAKKQTILLPSLTPVHRVHDPPQAQDSLKESSCAGCCAVSCNTAQNAGQGILAVLSTVSLGAFSCRHAGTFRVAWWVRFPAVAAQGSMKDALCTGCCTVSRNTAQGSAAARISEKQKSHRRNK